jgi:ribosomal protein S18 acetylase RimI-like enzyme
MPGAPDDVVRPPEPQPWLVTTGRQDPATVDRLLHLLPDWFGIEPANVAYVESAAHLPTYLAWPSTTSTPPTTSTPHSPAPATVAEPVGVLLAARHFPTAAEIHLMAVDPAWQGRGVGRALVAALEADLITDGVTFLQVKTLGPTSPDEDYARTRHFYTSVGFQPLEELEDLWPGSPCLIMIKSLPSPPAG